MKATPHLFLHHAVADGIVKEYADRVPAVLGSHQGRTEQYHVCASLFSHSYYVLHALSVTTSSLRKNLSSPQVSYLRSVFSYQILCFIRYCAIDFRQGSSEFSDGHTSVLQEQQE